MIRALYSMIFSLLSICISQAQLQPLEQLDSLMYGQQFSRFFLEGNIEKSLPVTIVLARIEDRLQGYAYYGDNMDRYYLEGTISNDGTIDLDEYDSYHRVTGYIDGNLLRPYDLFAWSSSSSDLTLSMTLYTQERPPHEIELFESTDSEKRSQIFIREDLRQISINPLGEINLRWIDFLCEGINCYENRPNIKLDNPVEFELELKDYKFLKVYPDHSFRESQVVPYVIRSAHSFDKSMSIAYPDLGDDVFSEWMSEYLWPIVLEHDDEFVDKSDRFQHRYTSDFYITMMSDELMSGYIYSQSTEDSDVITAAFIFDRNKSKFYRLNDIFEKNFDYAFFLERYLEKVKRGRMINEHRMVQSVLKKEDYSHLILAPEGLIFFTDFHVLYGRRHILVPYEEVRNSINNKAIQNYLKKERL